MGMVKEDSLFIIWWCHDKIRVLLFPSWVGDTTVVKFRIITVVATWLDRSDDNFGVLESERDIATHIVTIHDDPTLNPWTLRAFILGLGLSAFGGVLGKSFTLLQLIIYRWNLKFWTAEIYHLKPVWAWPLPWLLTDFNKLSAANAPCLDVVPGYYFVCSWDSFRCSNTTMRILALP